LRVPILTHEQTVQVGLANRITARFATTIALTFESARQELPAAQRGKAIVTGNPVRPLIFGGDGAAAARWAGFARADEQLPTIYVTGGSQGARIINRAVEAALPDLLKLCRVIHQCGQQPDGEQQDYNRLEQAAAKLPPELRRRYYFTRFVGAEIKDVFALADLVVGRAGAGTIAEICVLGKPALYIPLVPTGGDEQTRNAQACAAAPEGKMAGCSCQITGFVDPFADVFLLQDGRATQHERKLVSMLIHEPVLYSGSLAKYRAAFLEDRCEPVHSSYAQNIGQGCLPECGKSSPNRTL